ncbi:MAG: GNAT family N-acetyltransferase [Chloroflexota bacterium]|jgi:RimJ/RimL family protein N-acetyltransferase
MTWAQPTKQVHNGTHVQVRPLSANKDVAALYDAGHASVLHLATWRYLPYGPFADVHTMHDWLVTCEQSNDPLFHTVVDRQSGTPVGMMSIMSIVAQFGRAELGHIWYDARVQRSSITTETSYLMLSYLFEELNYRRVEWKCDNNNLRSKNAALRLGFQYEGLFRKHLIVKSQNRDTAWFAMTDDEWPITKHRLQSYLA